MVKNQKDIEESESNMQDSPSKYGRMEGNKICSQTLDEFEKVKRGIERTKKNDLSSE